MSPKILTDTAFPSAFFTKNFSNSVVAFPSKYAKVESAPIFIFKVPRFLKVVLKLSLSAEYIPTEFAPTKTLELL